MEKAFLKIARVVLVAVIGLSLLSTAMAAIYGAIQLLPSRHANVSVIHIDPRGLAASNDAKALDSEPSRAAGTTPEDTAGAAKQCQLLAPKMNRVFGQVGWEKKSEEVYNPNTMLNETKYTVEYDEHINVEVFCKGIQDFIEEQDTKLSPYFQRADTKEAYYRELNSFLDFIETRVTFDHALAPEDTRRDYFQTSLERFNNQFAKAVDDAKDRAMQKEAEDDAGKVRGKVALYVSGIAFTFFFSCCLILVFIRIEVNTRVLADVIGRFEGKGPGAPAR